MQIMSVTAMGGKTAKRYHVHFYLDSEGMELDVPLYGSEIKAYGIVEGAELPDTVYYEITDKILRTRIITRCEYLLNMKAYTEAELTKKLKEGYYPEPLIEEAVDNMKAYHFLDDHDYASRYVELNQSKKSRRRICMDLKNKGIEEHIIEEVTVGLEYLQSDVLEEMVHKRCAGKNLSDQKEWNKHFRFFIGKGFNYDEISAILGRVKKEMEE